ncbi:MAG: signal recognition particle-docking protein FtsY [candidate division Zixibacteria bacterium]|nr:signal recognition particle-docking protein FtsY [candidate division Zixibacteria bacterium]
MFNRFKKGLAKTRNGILGKIGGIFGKKIDEELLEQLEESLINADVGPVPAAEIIETLRNNKKDDPAEILKEEICRRVNLDIAPQNGNSTRPYVILFVGVNGTGKTTSIGKLAWKFNQQKKSVILAAGDTFRAAASEQLGLWADKTGAQLIQSGEGADPASVAFDAIKAGVAKNADYVLIDTAGRLQTRVNLMEELKKIHRVAGKAMAGAPHEVWLVLDASIGQNSFSQVELFNQATNLTGLVLAKLDGTSKGGAVIAISEKYKVPVRYVGLGEAVDDIEEFSPEQFATALVEQ